MKNVVNYFKNDVCNNDIMFMYYEIIFFLNKFI